MLRPSGIGAENHPDAFRDADGELVETEEFFRISGLHLNQHQLAALGVGPGDDVRVLPPPYRAVRSRLGVLARDVGFTEDHLRQLRSEMAASVGEDLER